MEHHVQLTALLNALSKRVHSSDTPDLSPAIAIVNDLGRVIMHGDESDVRHLQAATGAVYEQLVQNRTSAYELLTGPYNRTFLAGALWAVCAIMGVSLD